MSSLTDKLSKYCDTIQPAIKNIWQQPNITIVRVNHFKQLYCSGRIQKKQCPSNLGWVLPYLGMVGGSTVMTPIWGIFNRSGSLFEHLSIINASMWCCTVLLISQSENCVCLCSHMQLKQANISK